MKAQHTPGPWRVGTGEAIKIYDTNGYSLATVTHIHMYGRRDGNEVAANARLIAAAPELLTELIFMVEQFENAIDNDPVYSELADGARSAIAKARGES